MFDQVKKAKRTSVNSCSSTEEESLSPLSPDTSDDDTGKNSNNDSFLHFFINSKGPPQIVFLCVLMALALGSTVGVVPAVMTDRYARLNHGFDGDDCASYGAGSKKPDECAMGSQDAQNVSALQSLVSNLLSFSLGPVVGSLSDTRGRKGILILGMLLFSLSPLTLVLIQTHKSLSPFWYYATNCLSGLINWLAVSLSSVSDVVPERWRAASFGLIIAGFALGFAFSPALALTVSHVEVSVFSVVVMVGGLFFAIFCLPETLEEEVRESARRSRAAADEEEEGVGGGGYYGWRRRVFRVLTRPVVELSILNRSGLFRILSTLAFLGGMVTAADQNLLLYYLEERYDFHDQDISMMFLTIGLLGIFVQSVLLKQLNDRLGEKSLLIFAFTNGTVVNLLYGVAPSKGVIFVGIALGTLTNLSFPTISAIKSNNVNKLEQGRIQGALSSVSSLASAVGPLSLRFVYNRTKDVSFLGPGTMYVFAAFLYFVATLFACLLPKEKTDSKGSVGYERTSRGDCDADADADGRELKYGATT